MKSCFSISMKTVAAVALGLAITFPVHAQPKAIQETPVEAMADLMLMFSQAKDEKAMKTYVDSLHMPAEFKEVAIKGIQPQREAIAKAGGVKNIYLKRVRPDTETTSSYMAVVVGNDNSAVNFLVSLTKIKSDWVMSNVEFMQPRFIEVFKSK